jgi:hypothetical protein
MIEQRTRQKYASPIDLLRGKEPKNIHRNQKLTGVRRMLHSMGRQPQHRQGQ